MPNEQFTTNSSAGTIVQLVVLTACEAMLEIETIAGVDA